MDTATIRKKLIRYMETAEERKVKALYTIIEDEIKEENDDWDDDLIKELNKRSSDFTKGTIKTYTWEETKQAAIRQSKKK
ncbi:MAG: hypothetical protein ACRDE2_09950 [Chitinophagaceae bacterium]